MSSVEVMWNELYGKIPSDFQKVIERPVEATEFLDIFGKGLGRLESVPTILRTQGFFSKTEPGIALLVRDNADPEVCSSLSDPEEVPWQMTNRQLWFYTDTNWALHPFARYFSSYIGYGNDFRIDEGFGPPYFGLCPIFNSSSVPIPKIIEYHKANGKHIFEAKADLIKGEELVDRALRSLDNLIQMSPKVRETNFS